MSFLSKAEYSGSISTTIINTLTNSTDEAVNFWTDEAVEVMKSFLRSKYSPDTIFSQTGETRNKLLMRVCKDLAIYNLYSMSNIFRKIPDIRVQRYTDAIQWLKDVQSEKINPLLYGTGSTGYTITIKSGSNDKRGNYQT